MSRSFVTFTVGDRAGVHRQANFAALSLLANADWDPSDSIVIVTDQPEWYRWLEGRVTTVHVDEATLEDWKGPAKHFFRIKIKAIQHALGRRPGDMIYIDADIVCHQNLRGLFDVLSRGGCLMHEYEYQLSTKGGNAGEIWAKARGGRFGNLTLDTDVAMWNAGVVAIPEAAAERLLSEALECMDAMSASGLTSSHLEQLSLSMALAREGELRPASEWLLHYWGNKAPWNALIAAFLARVALQQLTPDEACAAFKEIDLSLPLRIPRGKGERFMNSLRKRLFPRDHEVAAAVERNLTA